jgi:hypothetical protein
MDQRDGRICEGRNQTFFRKPTVEGNPGHTG